MRVEHIKHNGKHVIASTLRCGICRDSRRDKSRFMFEGSLVCGKCYNDCNRPTTRAESVAWNWGTVMSHISAYFLKHLWQTKPGLYMRQRAGYIDFLFRRGIWIHYDSWWFGPSGEEHYTLLEKQPGFRKGFWDGFRESFRSGASKIKWKR